MEMAKLTMKVIKFYFKEFCDNIRLLSEFVGILTSKN